MNEGWACPRCMRVYSPKTQQCLACNEVITVLRKIGHNTHNPACDCLKCRVDKNIDALGQ